MKDTYSLNSNHVYVPKKKKKMSIFLTMSDEVNLRMGVFERYEETVESFF